MKNDNSLYKIYEAVHDLPKQIYYLEVNKDEYTDTNTLRKKNKKLWLKYMRSR